MKARVYVTLKKEVLDPQGQAVKRSLRHLGFDTVSEVRVGKYLEVTLEGEDPEEAKEKLHEMGKRLLSNEVIEDFHIDLQTT